MERTGRQQRSDSTGDGRRKEIRSGHTNESDVVRVFFLIVLWIDVFGLLTAHFTCVILTNNITFAGDALLFVGVCLVSRHVFLPGRCALFD